WGQSSKTGRATSGATAKPLSPAPAPGSLRARQCQDPEAFQHWITAARRAVALTRPNSAPAVAVTRSYSAQAVAMTRPYSAQAVALTRPYSAQAVALTRP